MRKFRLTRIDSILCMIFRLFLSLYFPREKKLDLKKKKITREYLCFIEICFATLIAVSFLIKTNIKIEIHCVSHFYRLWNTRNEANSRRKNKYRPSHLLRNLIRLPSKSFILPLNKLKATSHRRVMILLVRLH